MVTPEDLEVVPYGRSSMEEQEPVGAYSQDAEYNAEPVEGEEEISAEEIEVEEAVLEEMEEDDLDAFEFET